MTKATKTIIWLIVAIIIIGGIWYGMSRKPAEKGVIKIGVTAPLTGPTAWWGEFIKQGLELALEELSDEEISNIKIIWEDDQCSAKVGVSAVQKLIFIDNVKYVLGPLCNEVSIPTENLFEDNRVVSITTGLPNNQIANMGKYHFSFLPEIEFLMKELADYVYFRTTNRQIGIVYLDDAYGYENYIHFKKYFEANGGKIVAEEPFPKTEPEVRSQLTKIKNSNPDAILLVAYGPALINILKEMEELGMVSLDRYGINSFESPTVLKEVPELAEGVVYPTPASKLITDSVNNYTLKYKNKYGAENDVYSANMYDSFNILFSAIKYCGYEKISCVLDILSSVDNYEGANGIFSVDERGVGTYQGIMLKTVRENSFIILPE